MSALVHANSWHVACSHRATGSRGKFSGTTAWRQSYKRKQIQELPCGVVRLEQACENEDAERYMDSCLKSSTTEWTTYPAKKGLAAPVLVVQSSPRTSAQRKPRKLSKAGNCALLVSEAALFEIISRCDGAIAPVCDLRQWQWQLLQTKTHKKQMFSPV